MPFETAGLHHVTAIASDPQANLDFYAGALGLRLVKRTVNFDDPGTYHFYFGDTTGRPGSLLTFFPWTGFRRGRPGPGQVTRVSFAIPAASLAWWSRRLEARDIPARREDARTLAFDDPDGLALALVADESAGAEGVWAGGPAPPEHALRALHGVRIDVARAGPTLELLRDALGFRPGAGDAASHPLIAAGSARGSRVDVRERAGAPTGLLGAGTVHHVAWRARDDAEQEAWRQSLLARGLNVTPVQDRQYFRSIYFHEPGGVLYEIATDPPGFTLDESPDQLGEALRLPPWLEPARSRIERGLPPIRLPREPQPR